MCLHNLPLKGGEEKHGECGYQTQVPAFQSSQARPLPDSETNGPSLGLTFLILQYGDYRTK